MARSRNAEADFLLPRADICIGGPSCHHRGPAYVRPYPQRFPYDAMRVRARRLDQRRTEQADPGPALRLLLKIAALRPGVRVTTPSIHGSPWYRSEGTFIGIRRDGNAAVEHSSEFNDRTPWSLDDVEVIDHA